MDILGTMQKKTVAMVIGAVVVAAAGAVATKKLIVGSSLGAVVLGAALTAGAHEAFDAPVSGWVYKQL
jgi:hypothetical protein